ncbi:MULTISPECIES: class 1b ribonucleoside-diphosphate reductase subunit alpha [Vibrio]|uniref:Ribonucleoside-diphosphate reductase n=1 Tax=Vibrio tasmaniensis TaxID=212663 RepID=A0A2N7NDH6_9VIBR|nr:class 1b ribonucleoside-diphosphate reductase subunit alpha [Vibrio tasmaniensis]PMP10611.1 ribonucleotide-diphosphate reductase subunit alpha [Vibrio tasmaniensis]TKG34427.1 class 1b ribonucleoside-diphosphate reductase subunit alpha [Vibrio tasmaniensis]TKG43066.1 class 1b ribonucleoside-diphosphate reductase subunit alpha [Vibrio tasmaniensis]TKG44993.1 class 1b ribonucleoside-diphosphate reductase subunit alpha [Vibrio tasmaniensis]TKG53703.1 class 1b ribonucleoside-diphosphate reductas
MDNHFENESLDYHALNAMLNLLDEQGTIQFEADKQAARQFFLQHVNQNTVFFHNLDEKIDYLLREGYYEAQVIEQYDRSFLHQIWANAYQAKFRFRTFLGAYKFFTSYALKTRDGKRYLERFEDRVVMTALLLARGDCEFALALMEEIIHQRFQPATPTFINSGKKSRGELISCFLLRIEDNMESIGRAINSSLQLSRRGGGVALLLTNLREQGAPIKGILNQSSGVVPVMKLLEDSFSYANQLGSRQGAGAVYLNVHHPDIMQFLDTKRENADEKIRIKTLSLGVVIPDITLELAKQNKDMYLFSPHDVERVYGVPFSEICVTEKYHEMVDDPRIRKGKMSARGLFQTLAEIQFESGYPYIMFEDTVNQANPIQGRVNMSNLCSEILQVNEASNYDDDLNYSHVGRDISCNLGSINIAKALDGGRLSQTVDTAIRALNAVSEMSAINSVPSIRKGNDESHAIGLGQMNLHGFLARERIHYDSPEAIDFTSSYFACVLYHCLVASNKLAQEKKSTFKGFEDSSYSDGSFFDKYLQQDFSPKLDVVQDLFSRLDIRIPTVSEWNELKQLVMSSGLYNRYLQAIPPTGSISYINDSTASIHPVTAKVEIRKEGKIGRVYFPAPYLNNSNLEYFRDAFSIGPKAIIDVYAAATEHVDQGLSLTLFFDDEVTTRDINKAQIYAWKKKIKTLYYIRMRQKALEGTQVEGCVSCSL